MKGIWKELNRIVVSDFAKKRGSDQLGTIGSGNHFVEVDRVSNLYDEKTAATFGLEKNQIVILIHTGSRGLGHQVATDYLKMMMNVMGNYNFRPRDRELAGVPFNSPEGQAYFNAMAAAANFAWCNREVITHEIRQAWKSVFKRSGDEIQLLYDVAHNIAKIETYTIEGVPAKLIVHRKGATRAFGPGNHELPEIFRDAGQPVFIPGSMGTSSYVLAGTRHSMDATFGSTCHGAGRRLSRTAAKKQVDAPQLKEELRQRGIFVQSGSFRGIAEEAPIAYKDVDMVVDTVHDAGIALKVAKLKPIAVIKG
jgi:tRNA-splicing ligase RtcB (3'-phosphate/5'-hydroxy nucleic acid ligase)